MSQSSIGAVEREARRLRVRWADGGEASYPYIWLRDNCRCAACGDKAATSGERFLKLTDVPLDDTPDDAVVAADGAVHMVWRGLRP